MKLADVLGAPVHDPVSTDGVVPRTCRVPDYPDTDEIPAPGHRHSTLIVVSVLAAVAVGVVAGWFASDVFAPEFSAASTVGPERLPAGVAGYAELYTAMHLSGSSAAGEGSDAVWINQTAAVDGVHIDDHTWQVIVAVDSLELIDGTYQTAAVQYFSVVVSTTGGRPSGTGLPARIPAPSQVATTGSVFSQPVPQDQAATAIAFLEQYLTAGPELNRYLADPSGVNRFDTAPYGHIVSLSLGANSLGQVRVAVSAAKENGITHQLEYVLTMAIANGVWVIENVSPAAG